MMSPEKLVTTASDKGFKAIAMSDHGTMAGIYSFTEACKKNSIKPIIGCEVYYNANLKNSKTAQDRSNQHIAVFAKTKEGYENLVKLSSRGWIEGFYYRPRVNEEILMQYKKDMVITTACMGGILAPELRAGDIDAGHRKLQWLQSIYGEENVFVEIQILEIPENVTYVENIIKMKDRYPDGVKLILGQDSHYPNREDWTTHEVMLNIQANKVMSSPDRRIYPTKLAHIRTKSEQAALKKQLGYDFITDDHWEESIANTTVLADLVTEFDIKHDTVYVDVKKYGFEGDLKKLVVKGVSKRGINKKDNFDDYFKRLSYEMSIIKKMGIGPYFLATHAIVDIARNNDVLVGPGRGSAAGSLVNYLIGTTNVDPIEHELLFERFINPDRVELPDIDVDYSNIDIVNSKLRETFGEQNVTRLATYSFFQWKGMVRDLARVFQYDIGETNDVAKAIDSLGGKADKLDLPALRKKINKVDEWVDRHKKDNVEMHMLKLHNLIRHKGVHAAGVIITDKEVYNWFPVERHRDIIVSAYTEGQKQRELNEVGGIKFDVLGLNTLRIHQDCLKLIARRRGKKWQSLLPLIDSSRMNLEDKKVYKNVFNKGDTIDIFQFESSTGRRILKDVDADCFNDISAVNSLNRPGPLSGNYDRHYASAKRAGTGRKLHPIVDKILEDTYGTIIYQEQVVRLCKELGDLTNSEAELVRKGIFKLRGTHIAADALKQKEILGGIEKKLLTNAQAKGMSKDEIKELWKDIQAFVGYSFNKAHSVSYAAIAYTSAWLKTYFPIEWHCAYLNGVSEKADKVRDYINYLSRKGIKVKTPHVESAKISNSAAVVDDTTLRLGTNVLKNVGADLPRFMEIYASDQDDFMRFFIHAINDPDTNINKRVIEALIKVGFFDDYPIRNNTLKSMGRGHLLVLYNEFNNKRGRFKYNPKHRSVDDILAANIQFIDDLYAEVLKREVEDHSDYQGEVEIMNFSMREHPFEPFREKIAEVTSKLEEEKLGLMVEIIAVKEKVTKNGRPYRVLTVQDVFGADSYRVMIWENQIIQWNQCVGEGGLFIMSQPDPKFGTCKVTSYTNIPM